MATFVRHLKNGMGAFTAKDIEAAYRITHHNYGEANTDNVEEATDSDLRYIEGAGGWIPKTDRIRLGIQI